jgi:hypothetical protein
MVDRQSVAIRNKMDITADSNQNSFRDVQVSTERGILSNANNSDRNASQILNEIKWGPHPRQDKQVRQSIIGY